MLFTRELIDDLNNGTIVVSDVGPTIPGIFTLEQKAQFLCEACRASVKDDLNTAKVAVAVKAAGLDADLQWLRRNLAQVIWLLVQEFPKEDALYTKIMDLVQDLQKAALVTKSELLEVGAVPFLIELGVIPNKKSTKENTVRADLFYKIRKFNSLRESNEGFSKMLVCLQSFGAAAAESAENIPQIVLEIKSLIGYFDLDPNKVAALFLDIWEDQWENEAYRHLLPLFSAQAIIASLAFIFISYQKDGEVPPDNLYRLTVQLLKANAIKLAELWSHLSHEDASMQQLQQDALQAAFQVFISRTALNTREEAEPQQPGQDNLINMSMQQVEAYQASFRISAAVLNLDPRKLSTDALQAVWALNQKLELLKIAFEMEQLDLAWTIFGALKALGVEPSDYPPVNAWMAKMVLAGMTPGPPLGQHHVAGNVPLPAISPPAAQMLDRMGLSFSCSIELFIRLVRHWRQVLQHYLQPGSDAPTAPAPVFREAVIAQVHDELVQRIFPGMALMTPEPFCAAELWSLLELLPYRLRFEVYDAAMRVLSLKGRDTMDAIALHAASDNVPRVMKKVIGRMPFDKDSAQVADAAAKKDKDKAVKALTRNLAKCSHANPIMAADYLIYYVGIYGGHIDSLTDTLVDLSDVVLDVLTYRGIKKLTALKQRYKPDNVLLADTFVNVSRFLAQSARKLNREAKSEKTVCPKMHALLQMVLNGAKSYHSEFFAVLGDLLSICAAVHTLEDVGDSELPALAGGEILRTVKIINKEVRVTSKAAKAGCERLKDALISTKYGSPLALPLFIALAQSRNQNIIGVDRGVGSFNRKPAESRIRIVSGRYDNANKLMIQYAEFLCQVVAKENVYRDMMPSLSALLSPEKYALEPEVAFLLYRPILSRVPFPDPPASKESEDGEIPDGVEAPMEVEQDTTFGPVRWSHLTEAAEACLPADAKQGLTKPFYLMFWRFTITDIVSCEAEYSKQSGILQREQTDLEQEMKTIQEKHIGSSGFLNPKYIAAPEDRRLAVRHLKNRIDLLRDQIKLLDKEKSKQEERRKAGIKLFRSWKNHLLADSDHSKTTDAFLAHCVLPRCIQTPEDATFCAAFIRRLVLEDTPFFSFMYLMQQLVPLGMPLLHTLTEREADNFGIFLREVLQSIQGWWLDQARLGGLLAKQAFRMDARTYAAPTIRHASASLFADFAKSCNATVVDKLKANLKANQYTTVNERAAVNSMLVLNKIRTVCPAIKGLALQLATALKPIYLRLEPKKDNQGNFTESPVPMYTFAIRCHNDLNKSIVDNQRFDSGLTSTVPAIRLYDANAFQPKYATQPAPPEPKPQRRAPSASIDRPTAQAEAADPPAAASSKPPRESSHAPKTLREGPTRPSGTSRSAKESVGRDSPRETRDANGKDSKEGSTRDTRDRGREASSRGSKEHGDKLSSAREGRDGSRAVGKAADDKQLADVRAAALKAAVNGTSGDAGSGRASARRDELVNGAKASGVNGTTAVPGTKRRVPDSGTTESRGSKVAKTDAASGPAAAAPTTRSSARRADAASGDRAELRADAPEFRPSPAVPRTKSQPATKPPADGVVLQPSSQRPAEAADRRAKEDKPLEANASQPSDAGAGPSRKAPGGSVKPPIHPEAVPRAAGKRARDTEPVLDAAKAGSQPDATKVAGDELEPKRRKHKPIAWAPPPPEAAQAPQQPVSERRSTERRSADDASARDTPRRSSSDAAKASAKPEQLERKIRDDKERPRARLDVRDADEAKRAQRDSRHEEADRRHAQRDSHRAEPAVRQTRSDSHRVEAAAKHAQLDTHREQDSERAQRGTHKDRDTASARDTQKLRNTEAHATPPSKRSTSRSEDKKSATVRAAAAEEQEDGEVQMAVPVAQAAPAKPVEENGLASLGASPGGDHAKDDSDGKESKRSHHKKKDSKEKRKKGKKDHKKDKDPERARAKAEKKAAKEAAKAKAAPSAAPSDAAAPAASFPPSSQPPAAQPDSLPPAPPQPAPAQASQPSVAPRLSSSIARADGRSSPPAPPRVEARTGPGASHSDRREASAVDRSNQHGLASQALPPDDLRHMLSRPKSNTDEVIMSEPVEPRPSMRRQGSHHQQQQQQQQRHQQAPHMVDDRDLILPRTRLPGPPRHMHPRR